MGKKVYGVGYDSGGCCKKTLNRVHTKPYSLWKDMLRRCYSDDYQNKHETYKNTVVDKAWHDFQNFAVWFSCNYRAGFELDKDILGDGKLYSENTCTFIPKDLNLLLTNKVGKSRNYNLPLGVCSTKTGKFAAYCNDGYGKTVNLGSKYTPEEAFKLYKGFKESLIREKAENYYRDGLISESVYLSLLKYTVN